jgi:hypothetical protein
MRILLLALVRFFAIHNDPGYPATPNQHNRQSISRPTISKDWKKTSNAR